MNSTQKIVNAPPQDVRQRQDRLAPYRLPPAPVLPLSARLRVRDDGIQWIVEVRQGRERPRATGWRARSWCLSRTGLRRVLCEVCGEVDPGTSEALASMPEFHPGR